MIKYALKLLKKPGNKFAKLLSKYKKTFLNMKTYRYEEFISKFSDKNFIIETKIDGELTLLVKDGNSAALYSRHGRVRTDTTITDEILQNKHDELWIVGELYALSETGGPQTYAKSMSMLRKPKSGDEERFRFSAFDLYKIDGEELYDKIPYEERLNSLKKIIPKTYKYIHIAPHKKGDINTFKKEWEDKVKKQNWEGLVVYFQDEVVKVKEFFPIDLVVIGVTKNTSHKDQIGALVCAFMLDKNKFLISSKVGTGFTDKDRREWLSWAKKYKISEDDKTIWVKPIRIIEVRSEEFLEKQEPIRILNKNGYEKGDKETTITLRKPVFIRIRTDKDIDPKELGRDQVPLWNEKHASILKRYIKRALEGPDYMDYDLDKAYALWLNYVKAMERRKRQAIPFENFARHIINFSAFFREGNSYIFGSLRDGVFIPTHFSPASLKEGMHLIKNLKDKNVIFFVPPDLGNMLEKVGYKKIPLLTITKEFRGIPIKKGIYVSSLKLLPILLKWGIETILEYMTKGKLEFSDLTYNSKADLSWQDWQDYTDFFSNVAREDVPESFLSEHDFLTGYREDDDEDYEDDEEFVYSSRKNLTFNTRYSIYNIGGTTMIKYAKTVLADVNDTLNGGNADNYNVADIAERHHVSPEKIEEQLAKGIQVEMEHTNNPEVAREIALDHLYESPDYYDKLEKMESTFENEGGGQTKETSSKAVIVMANFLQNKINNLLDDIQASLKSIKDEGVKQRFIDQLKECKKSKGRSYDSLVNTYKTLKNIKKQIDYAKPIYKEVRQMNSFINPSIFRTAKGDNKPGRSPQEWISYLKKVNAPKKYIDMVKEIEESGKKYNRSKEYIMRTIIDRLPKKYIENPTGVHGPGKSGPKAEKSKKK